MYTVLSLLLVLDEVAVAVFVVDCVVVVALVFAVVVAVAFLVRVCSCFEVESLSVPIDHRIDCCMASVRLKKPSPKFASVVGQMTTEAC